MRYTRCNTVILMAAAAWLTSSFSSCIVCGFDSYMVLFKCPQSKIAPPPSPPERGIFYIRIYEYTNQIRCNIVTLMAATAWLMLSFSSCIVCRFDSYTVLFKCRPDKGSISLRYIRYTSTRLDVRSCVLMSSCVLMKEATTFNIFYDGISFQHLATVLISVFTLCYRPGLLFRGPSCIFV